MQAHIQEAKITGKHQDKHKAMNNQAIAFYLSTYHDLAQYMQAHSIYVVVTNTAFTP